MRKKKYFNKIMGALSTSMLVLSICACGNSSANIKESATVIEYATDTESNIENATTETTIPEETDETAKSESSEYFTERDLSGEYSEKDSVVISFDDGKLNLATTDNPEINVSDVISSATESSLMISEEGTYILRGDYDGSIIIDVDDTEKVQLVLDGFSAECADTAAIFVKQADKVFVTLADGTENTLSTTGEFKKDEEYGIDAVIFSKEDLVINGNGTLNIESTAHGVVSKDDLKITGGSITVSSAQSGLRGNDSVSVTAADVTITSGTDAIHAENNDDASLGYIYIKDGTFTIKAGGDGFSASNTILIEGGEFDIESGGGSTGNIQKAGGMDMPVMFGNASQAADDSDDSESTKAIKADDDITVNGGSYNIDSLDDGIHSNSDISINAGTLEIKSDDDAVHADGLVEINGGEMVITAAEGIEATYVRINDGTIDINAQDDGINAGKKSDTYNVTIEINGGYLKINMGQGDTDAIDSNGDLFINGGTIDITGQSPFDYDGMAVYNGGTIITNGVETNTISNQSIGGGMMGGGRR